MSFQEVGVWQELLPPGFRRSPKSVVNFFYWLMVTYKHVVSTEMISISVSKCFLNVLENVNIKVTG